MVLRLSVPAIVAVLASVSTAAEFLPPRQLMAGGKPIDTQRIGHSAPFVADFNNDGRDDLLVGEFYEGRMRVFVNVGAQGQPEFDQYQWFQASGQLGRVPVG